MYIAGVVINVCVKYTAWQSWCLDLRKQIFIARINVFLACMFDNIFFNLNWGSPYFLNHVIRLIFQNNNAVIIQCQTEKQDLMQI